MGEEDDVGPRFVVRGLEGPPEQGPDPEHLEMLRRHLAAGQPSGGTPLVEGGDFPRVDRRRLENLAEGEAFSRLPISSSRRLLGVSMADESMGCLESHSAGTPEDPALDGR